VPTARDEIGRLQRALFQRQRRLIADAVQRPTPEFTAYEARARRRVRRHLREAAYDELLEAVAQSDLVYVGDYHTLKQAQRSFLKLVQRLAPRGRPTLLALEFVQGRHQPALDEYLGGRLSASELLERIEYRRHQRFEVWPHFAPIFEEARRRKLPVVAIDRAGTLAERDQYAARRIAAAVARHPRAQVLALTGQLHVAPPHLPAAVARALGRSGRGLQALSVYQNCEDIYWALQAEGRELDVEAVLIRPGEWCLINTPPVVVQQSYLDWIEGGDAPLESDHPERRFKELALLVARFLKLDDGAFREALDGVQIYTSADLGFLGRLPERGFSRREIGTIRRQILARESYYIPRARIAYLANLSVNHAAEEATHFLRHVVSGATDEPRGNVDSFYARALEEAYAFCGSKIVNPRRKCPHEPEFERLARGPDRFQRDVARFVLAHKRLERGERPGVALRNLYAGSDAELFNAVTHSLGYILGERLYYALARGRILKREVRQLFLDPLDEDGTPILTYLDLASRLADVRIPPRS
jgi:hypothetical protein